MRDAKELAAELLRYSVNGELPHWRIERDRRAAKLEVLREIRERAEGGPIGAWCAAVWDMIAALEKEQADAE